MPVFDPAIFDPAIFDTGAAGFTATDSTSVSDAATRAAIVHSRTASDSTTVSDAVVIGQFVRSLTDTVGLSDAATQATTRPRTASDTVTTSDAVARALFRARTATDTTSLTDAVVGVVTAGSVFNRTTTDTVSVTDSIASTRRWLRTGSDSASVTDAATRALGAIYTRIAIDTIPKPLATLTYTALAPVASFTYDPTSGPEPLHVQFTDTSTYEPTEWLWDFGDGGSSTEQNPEHIYAQGSWSVTLTVTNATGSDSVTI